MEIVVENIRCGGCVATISNKLKKVHNLTKISIDVENGIVSVDELEENRTKITATLLKLGYPEINSITGFDKTKAKVKSVVSCAVGKFK